MPRTSSLDRLARRLHELARDHARNERRQVERWRVVSLDPLTATSPDGDIIAAESDPDFHLASRVRDYDDDHGIKTGDMLIVAEHDDDEWTALDVEAKS